MAKVAEESFLLYVYISIRMFVIFDYQIN